MKPVKVFLDTNIFLNTLLAEKDCRDCTRILANWPKMKRVKEVVTSCLTFANIAYILRKRAGKEKVAPSINNLLNYVSSLSADKEEEYSVACLLRGPDFEDILQYVNATLSGCSILVTTNGKDFLKISDPDGSLPGKQPQILSPKEFLEKMNA